MNHKKIPLTNFNERKKKLKYLVLHYTGQPSSAIYLDCLKSDDPIHQVSAHYLIDENGDTIQFVDEEMRAWHAGKSYWDSETDINSASIGIEIQNAGHEFGYKKFPEEQINSVIKLCQDIIKRNNILSHDVIAHSDISAGRKEDPGELFPWERLASKNIGVWHDITEADKLEASKIIDDQNAIKNLLQKYGYNPDLDLKTLITAFQRRFEPEVFLTPEQVGKHSLDTISKLVSLVRLKNQA